MAHGTKPYGRTTPLERVFGVQDLGELAARLWSPDTFDRRGNVLFMDGMEGGINKWIRFGFGVGGALTWSGAAARSGGFSALLTSGTGGLPYTAMRHYEPFPVLSTFGAEFSVQIDNNIEYVILSVTLYDGAFATRYAVRYDHAAGQIQYQDAFLVYQNIQALTLSTWWTLFHTWKLIFDPVTMQYRYLILNSNAYDLRGLAPWNVANLANPYVLIEIHAEGDGVTSTDAYVDDVIFTQNEP